MKSYPFILVIFFLAVCGQSQQRPFTNSLPKQQTELIRQMVNEFPAKTQISIGIIKNGEVSFGGLVNEKGYSSWVNNQRNVFEIGSISKVFTATLLANLAEGGKHELDDTIDQYIKTPLKDNVQITLVQLANHTSGLPRLPTNFNPSSNPTNPYKEYDEEKLKDYLSTEIKISKNQKGNYLYSNLGVGLLGYTLCEIEDESYESLLQRHIFLPYKMGNSTTDRSKIERLLVKGLDVEGNQTLNWDLAALVGAGGVLSSTEDLSKFVIAHFDKKNTALSLTRTPTHTINHISDIGLGWEVINRRSGDIWYKHNGRTGGYYAALIMDVTNKNGVILLTNLSGYSSHSTTINDLSFELMKSLKKN